MFALLFFILYCNLMKRSENCVDLKVRHICVEEKSCAPQISLRSTRCKFVRHIKGSVLECVDRI